MGKYFLLTQYLQKSEKTSEFLSYAEIEEILGQSLPSSASVYREWWANHIYNAQSKGWMNAGWRVDSVRLGQDVTFERNPSVPATSATVLLANKNERPQTVMLIKKGKEAVTERGKTTEVEGLSEDAIKQSIKKYLDKNNWVVDIAWGRRPGIDIDASRDGERWIIEVKGQGSRNAMRVNYFIAVLGELLQRMDDSSSRYSIALPDLPQFRNLWRKLPQLAKQKTGITCLFVDPQGNIKEER
jgi:hypothetical protein